MLQKFVASRDAAYALPWENSTLLHRDAADAVARLKKEHDKTLVMFGSGALLRALMAHDLVDDIVLMIHPLILGEGRRLFDSGATPLTLTLADEMTTETGVIVASYHRASE